MKKELQFNSLPQLPAKLAGQHQVHRALFTLRASTWATIDMLRSTKDLSASQYIESLILKAARGQ